MQRIIILHLILITAVIKSFAMDFGLRLNSHLFPLEKRTSLSLGDSPIAFDNDLMIEFHFNFYTEPLFGTLVSVTTDDNSTISIVASHQGENVYSLGLVANEKMELIKQQIAVSLNHEDQINLSLDKRRNKVTFKYNNNKIELPVNLQKTKSASVVFGVNKKKGVTDVAPIELSKIRIFTDNKNTGYWDLKYHDTPTTRLDELNNIEAIAINPHWLIDDHTDWHLIYSETVKDSRQTTFDPETESFYIVGNKKIKVWRPLETDSAEYDISGGYRPMAYSNHLVYDTISGELVNYNLSQRCTARLNLRNGIWETSGHATPNEEANYANHAFAVSGNTAYAFGGYGFYKYHNDLFKIDLTTGIIEECKLHPEMMSTTSASAAIIGDKLYLFGGKGNNSGRQELPSKYKYAMYVYDTNTWEGELLWELDSVQHDYLPSQTMYYDAQEDCFYAGSTCHGGELIKISRTHPKVNVLSTPIKSNMEYYDIVFDLFRSKDAKRYYLVIDKRVDQYIHNYAIYTISAPFIDNPEIIKNKALTSPVKAQDDNHLGLFITVALFLVLGIVLSVMLYRRRKNKTKNGVSSDIINLGTELSDTFTDADRIEDITEKTLTGENDSVDEELFFFDKRSKQHAESKFNRTKSAISLLGAFNVRDKNGEDITTKFTDRLKSLLILLLLANNKSENGIKYQTIDEQIWGDKDEKSAQNNRNVYMRKLRILLEEVGDVPITYEKGYFKIRCNDIMYDYGEAINRISEIQSSGNASPELINETLDLLLMGPLLPMTTYEWLDQYKADYSDRALEILNKLLKYEFSRNDELSFKIAQIISCHEPLSEEAMRAKCILLIRKKMVGQAKKVHARFCKEYSLSLGEEYPVSFPDVCKSQI